MGIDNFAEKIRKKHSPFYTYIYNFYKGVQRFNLPVPASVASLMYSERKLRHQTLYWISNKFYYEPMLRHRCTSVGKNLRTDGDIPLIIGNGRIIIGDNVNVCNRGAWILASNLFETPELIIGDNTTLNYMTCISVECRVEIGKNCAIAGETMIFDNSSHSIYIRNNRKMTKDDVAPVTIEDHVWIGMRSMIFKGVTIGEGAVIAAGSIVSRDVPPFTLVAGNPARIIKKIENVDPDIRTF